MSGTQTVDLHTHSTASDGFLSPAELIQRAHENGVELLAITDHDTVAAYPQVTELPAGMRLIRGIEFSSRWRSIGIHIVGLNVRTDHATLREAIARQSQARQSRAVEIDRRLSRLGFRDTLVGATAEAGSMPVGRPHFARYLVRSGQVRDIGTAFRKYLGQGKPGDVRDVWPEPDEVIDWIRDSGGVAVLAHPMKYKLTNLKLEELTQDFAQAGGQAIEVVSGRQEAGKTRRLAKLANRLGLLASCGSDFHRPAQHWADVGRAGPLPRDCTPVWQGF